MCSNKVQNLSDIYVSCCNPTNHAWQLWPGYSVFPCLALFLMLLWPVNSGTRFWGDDILYTLRSSLYCDHTWATEETYLSLRDALSSSSCLSSNSLCCCGPVLRSSSSLACLFALSWISPCADCNSRCVIWRYLHRIKIVETLSSLGAQQCLGVCFGLTDPCITARVLCLVCKAASTWDSHVEWRNHSLECYLLPCQAALRSFKNPMLFHILHLRPPWHATWCQLMSMHDMLPLLEARLHSTHHGMPASC